MRQRILGLDTGTNSLGWAVVDRNEDNTYTLVDRGDLIFQEGVKYEKGIEKSKAAERTDYRGKRRLYFRRRLRKIEVLKVLVKYDLCPHLSPSELNLWHTRKIYPMSNSEFISWQRTNDNEKANPYYYRYICLTCKLDLSDRNDRYILGRAIYHLSQRRGFLSNRLDASGSNDDGKVKAGISDLSEMIEKSGCKYLGEYFYKLYSENGNTVRLRNSYTSREEHYKKEFSAICKMQELDDEMVTCLEKALYFQRPLKSQKWNIGRCLFEPKKSRCADSHPLFEEFRMLSFINNIKVKTPYDDTLRALNDEEKGKIKKLFFRKSKANFDFEDIAKELAGKGQYCYYRDSEKKPYEFNFRMSQGVASCHTIAQLISVFGEDWENSIMETYIKNGTKNGLKTADEVITDIWNVLHSFSSKEKLMEFGVNNLQLSNEDADKFSKIKLSSGYASLSLNAIRKIIPYLREGMQYSAAVFLANLGKVVPYVWSNECWKKELIDDLKSIIKDFNVSDRKMTGTLEFCIKDYLLNNYEVKTGAIDKLYHPSMIEIYPAAKRNENGVYQLGSPKTNSFRNPMAMRSLTMLRKVVNKLLKDKIIDENTEIHIEYARELNDANKRKALAAYNKDMESRRAKCISEITALYEKEYKKKIVPTESDVTRYILWEEQGHVDLYTGTQIGLADIIGDDPLYDIEHTVPRSVGGDSTMMNMTLCSKKYNRDVKRTKLPAELPDHSDILERLEPWKKKIESLRSQIDRIRTFSSMPKEQKDSLIQKRNRLQIEYDYWNGKYRRFIMTEVPEGFSLRQGVGAGVISKYAGLYLKSLFNTGKNRNYSGVYAIKGVTTAEFRRMWGLQSVYAQKDRTNHVHHCIDAVVIACIGKYEYDRMAEYYRKEESYKEGKGEKPYFPRPWNGFTEDMIKLEKELLVVHASNDNLLKQSKKKVITGRGTFMSGGDIARGSLHNESFYGAIMKDGEIKYVIRKKLSDLKETDIKNIVDETVRTKIQKSIEIKGFKEAMAGPIFLNEEKGIQIKKVRCIMPTVTKPLALKSHRNLSQKEYKRNYYVANDLNYLMAIYEDSVNGKVKRDYVLLNNLDSVSKVKENNKELYPLVSPKGYPLKYTLKLGTQVLLYEDNPEEVWNLEKSELVKRLYKVIGLTVKSAGSLLYGFIVLKFHQEARQSKDLKSKNGPYKVNEEYRPVITMLHTQLNALVEGVHFEMDILGNIKKIG